MHDTCPNCGSKKIIPDLPLLVDANIPGGGSAVGNADVYVCGAPQAWINKERTAGDLAVSVCGECGHAELHAKNFRLLFENYEKSRQP